MHTGVGVEWLTRGSPSFGGVENAPAGERRYPALRAGSGLLGRPRHNERMAAENRPEPSEYPEYILPHSDFGDPECCGLFFPRERGDVADLRCNECGFVLKTVPLADLRRTQDELQLSLEVASEQCPHCGAVDLFPGFSRMLAYTCRHCGEPVKVSDR
jgi:hypothetical protein